MKVKGSAICSGMKVPLSCSEVWVSSELAAVASDSFQYSFPIPSATTNLQAATLLAASITSRT